MLLHISIPAEDPKKVATVLAKICGGTIREFSPLPGAFMVFAHDQYGSGFEVYPRTTILTPGIEENQPSQFLTQPLSSSYSAVHCALRTNLDKMTIINLAQELEWRCIPVRRQNLFNVIEFWLENQFMLELITAEDLDEALRCFVGGEF